MDNIKITGAANPREAAYAMHVLATYFESMAPTGRAGSIRAQVSACHDRVATRFTVEVWRKASGQLRAHVSEAKAP